MGMVVVVELIVCGERGQGADFLRGEEGVEDALGAHGGGEGVDDIRAADGAAEPGA